jgi:hypothetical protein
MSRFASLQPLRLASALALGGVTLSLAGCGGSGLSRTFGLTRDAPDEFSVTTQAPLTVPPDFAIRPPQPGAPRPQDLPDREQAQAALIPQTALGGTTAGMSPGQSALVAQAGPAASANVRSEVAQDAARDRTGKSFADRLMFWRSNPAPGIVVDPTRESQRLRQNAALGQSPEAGETPIIQPKPRGWLEGIF